MSSRRSSSSRHASKPSSSSKSKHKKLKSPKLPVHSESTQNYSASSYDEDEDADWVGSGDEYSEERSHVDSFETKSLTESVREHVIEDGLRYHAYHAGQYPFPNDEVEQDRDDMKHLISVALCENNFFFAPIEEVLEEGAEVLDLGTGTGIWCTELADQFPNSMFLGLDLSPIQPDLVPPNVQFVVDDIEHENGWDYPENKFDYIHIRHTLHSIKDRHRLIERAFRHLKPGGYLEIQDFHYYTHCDDSTLNANSDYRLHDFLHYLKEGLAALGSDMYAILHAESDLRAAGFEHVRRKTFKCPIGGWPKLPHLAYYGDLMKNAMLDGLVGLSRKPFGIGLGWTPLQIEIFLVEVRKSLADKSFHTYLPLHSVYGRKPAGKSGKSSSSGGGGSGGKSSSSSSKHGKHHHSGHHKKKR